MNIKYLAQLHRAYKAVFLLCILFATAACERTEFGYAGIEEKDATKHSPAYTFKPDRNRPVENK